MEQLHKETRKLSLLYVEDEPFTRENLQRVISIKFPSITVYTAENGKIGLDLFKKYVPDIVLTDINLPVLDGIRMASAMWALNPQTEFIILSANSRTQYESDCVKIGIRSYLQKPIFHEDLVRTIEYSVDRLTI